MVEKEKVEQLIKTIESMSVLELSELIKALEERFGVSAAVPAMVGPIVTSPQVQDKTSTAEEKSVFSVFLTDVGANKVQVIKVVKDVTGRGLKESKDLLDNLPALVKEGIKKEEAEELKKKFEEAGAKVEIK